MVPQRPSCTSTLAVVLHLAYFHVSTLIRGKWFRSLRTPLLVQLWSGFHFGFLTLPLDLHHVTFTIKSSHLVAPVVTFTTNVATKTPVDMLPWQSQF